ncbi:MAG TPA: tRNA pseudouridine(38-40) synthase TruA [Solirubrobacteraceae bacterium]
MTARLLIEYDGTDFRGWARQPGLRTVQEELEGVLATLTRRPVALTVAGRTDAGVHAWGQVASYDGPVVPLRALNALLAPDVAVLACEPSADGFDARRDAHARTYCYRILRRAARSPFLARTTLHEARALDLDALHACATALRGTHDFTAFTPTETEHVRFERDVFDARWEHNGDLLEFWIEADTFMRNMNRVIVGTMLEVARGVRSVEDFTELLGGAPRSAAGATAPPQGLVLVSVRYEPR